MERKIGVSAPFLTDEQMDLLKKTARELGFEVQYFTKKPTEADVEGCEILFGGFSAQVIAGAKSLGWYQSSSAGVDWLLNQTKLPEEMVLTNASGAYGITISEHMIAVLLMLMRRMPEYYEGMKSRSWENIGQIRSIYGSKVTVLGVGDIGGNFAQRVKAMGAKVTGVRRHNREKPSFLDEQYTIGQLFDAVADADVVALCLPGTDETEHVITGECISHMKDGAILINIGRGSAVDQQALCQALNSGKLAGAALDVTVPEPLPADHPLWSAKNILITPHVSGNTSLPKTCDIIFEIFLDNLSRYAKGEPLRHVVDVKDGY